MKYNQAPIQFGYVDEHGKLIKSRVRHPLRWATIQDAEHDFQRICRGLPPERNVKLDLNTTRFES